MSKTDDHNKGQSDAASGKHSPPISLAQDLGTWTSKGCDEIIERNGAYSEGWNHANSQK